MSAKIRKSQATIKLGTSVQIYNLKVRAPVLYIVALSELKLNENSEHDEVDHRQPKLGLRAAHKLDCFFHAMHNNDIGNI